MVRLPIPPVGAWWLPLESRMRPRQAACPELRQRLKAMADPARAAYEKAYHKSQRQFLGLRSAELTAALKASFPPRELAREAWLPLAQELWRSAWFEERIAAIWLLEKLLKALTPADLSWLLGMTQGCEGWAETDYLATRILGGLALAQGEPVYREVRRWSVDPCLWTRRSAILIHVLPARRKRLAGEYAWPTFEEHLPEKEVFIRKAIGWALREAAKHYPHDVHAFLLRVGGRASGLTRREGARNLPPGLREDILGQAPPR